MTRGTWGPKAVYGSPPAPAENLSTPRLNEQQLNELSDRGPRWLLEHCALCGQFLKPRRNPWQRQTVDELDEAQKCECAGVTGE